MSTYAPTHLLDEVLALHKAGGLPRGDAPGWRGLNRLYTIAPGQLTTVTGTPGSGKSEFIDAMAVNLAEGCGWRFALYSPENHPVALHVSKLAEKRARKPFSDGPTRPMSADECAEASRWVLERFRFLRPADDSRTPVELALIAGSYKPAGVERWGCILDPWNTLEHDREGMSETDYISKALTMVQRITRDAPMHTWLVVHPKQLMRLKDGTTPIPRPYDISGSAHWFNKSDHILCVHRDKSDEESVETEIHVQKVRFKHIGQIGMATLRWDRVTGRYDEVPHIYDATAGKAERYA